MKICRECGGFFDDTCMICPVDGFNFKEEENRNRCIRRIKRIRKSLKWIAYSSVGLAIIVCVLTLVFFSGESVFQQRINLVVNQCTTPKDSLQSRLCQIENGKDDMDNRFKCIGDNLDKAAIRFSHISSTVECVQNRFLLLDSDVSETSGRLFYAVGVINERVNYLVHALN